MLLASDNMITYFVVFQSHLISVTLEILDKQRKVAKILPSTQFDKLIIFMLLHSNMTFTVPH